MPGDCFRRGLELHHLISTWIILLAAELNYCAFSIHSLIWITFTFRIAWFKLNDLLNIHILQVGLNGLLKSQLQWSHGHCNECLTSDSIIHMPWSNGLDLVCVCVLCVCVCALVCVCVLVCVFILCRGEWHPPWMVIAFHTHVSCNLATVSIHMAKVLCLYTFPPPCLWS